MNKEVESSLSEFSHQNYRSDAKFVKLNIMVKVWAVPAPSTP